MIRRTVLVIGALLLLGVGLAAPAGAGYTPPAGISVDKAQVDPGGQVTVSGEGCDVGADVSIRFAGTEVATATAGDDGTFSATFTVPAGTAPGSYSVEAVDCTAEVLSTTLTVLGATGTTAAAGTALPRTGTDTTQSLLRIGVVLLACGGLLVFAARRRAATASR